ncbi:MAG: YlxR family protein [Lachnospiraceae bacterium]|nr:YlxR family protein [Lachnospiraceae bacterium]
MKQKKIPMRKCIGCDEMFPKKELIRILLDEENKLVIDKTGKLNGRGCYLCNNAECLEKAIKTKAINRSMHENVPNEVYDELRRSLSDG